jgi:hypothetical protein
VPQETLLPDALGGFRGAVPRSTGAGRENESIEDLRMNDFAQSAIERDQRREKILKAMERVPVASFLNDQALYRKEDIADVLSWEDFRV